MKKYFKSVWKAVKTRFFLFALVVDVLSVFFGSKLLLYLQNKLMDKFLELISSRQQLDTVSADPSASLSTIMVIAKLIEQNLSQILLMLLLVFLLMVLLWFVSQSFSWWLATKAAKKKITFFRYATRFGVITFIGTAIIVAASTLGINYVGSLEALPTVQSVLIATAAFLVIVGYLTTSLYAVIVKVQLTKIHKHLKLIFNLKPIAVFAATLIILQATSMASNNFFIKSPLTTTVAALVVFFLVIGVSRIAMIEAVN